MSGPIVRTGTNPKFWEGWDKAFSKKQPTTSTEDKPAAAKAAKAPGKKTAKKAAKKATKKKA